jgi:hypothetical protein
LLLSFKKEGILFFFEKRTKKLLRIGLFVGDECFRFGKRDCRGLDDGAAANFTRGG